MKNFFSLLTKNQSVIYKALLFIVSTFLIIYLLPKGGQFKYNFQKGKPWQYENLYAPFSFTIKKSAIALESELEEAKSNAIPYFDFNTTIENQSRANFEELLGSTYVDTLFGFDAETFLRVGTTVLDEAFSNGVLENIYSYPDNQLVYLKNGNEVAEINFGQFFKEGQLLERLKRQMGVDVAENDLLFIEKLLKQSIKGNITLNTKLTESALESQVNAINPNRGVIEKGGRIIAKGEVVEGDTYQILESLKSEFESQVWTKSNYLWLIVGYSTLVSLVFLMLFLFLKKYRPEIFNNNTKVTFIFFNIGLMVFLTTMVVKFDAKYVYLVPLCILPLIL